MKACEWLHNPHGSLERSDTHYRYRQLDDSTTKGAVLGMVLTHAGAGGALGTNGCGIGTSTAGAGMGARCFVWFVCDSSRRSSCRGSCCA